MACLRAGRRTVHNAHRLHAQPNMPPSTPRGYSFSTGILDRLKMLSNSFVLLSWRKAAVAASFTPGEAVEGSCWQSSFSKATTEGDTGYYTSFIKFKRYLLNWSASCIPSTRTRHLLTPASSTYCNVLFGIWEAHTVLPSSKVDACLNATGRLQYCRLVGN